MKRINKSENDFQKELKDEIRARFPGALILKTDPTDIQGIADLVILYKDKWAALEVKKSERERKDPRPNQEYYVEYMNRMSYASFIYPENKEDVLDELETALES